MLSNCKMQDCENVKDCFVNYRRSFNLYIDNYIQERNLLRFCLTDLLLYQSTDTSIKFDDLTFRCASLLTCTFAKLLIILLKCSFFLVDVYHIEHAYVSCEMKIACIICLIRENFALYVVSLKLRNAFIDFNVFVLFWFMCVFQLNFVFMITFKYFISCLTLISWLNSESRMNLRTRVFFLRLK